MKRKLTILFFIILIAFTIGINVFAIENVDLKIDKNSVNSGDEITVSINFNEQNSYGYTAKLSYDKEIFEEIETNDFQKQNDWADITYNSATNKFALIKKNNENQEQNNEDNSIQVVLRVKDNAKAGKSTISLNSITASDGEKDTKLNSQSIEVDVLNDGLTEDESTPSAQTNATEDNDIAVKVEKRTPLISIILIIVAIAIIAFLILYDMRKEGKKNNKIIVTAVGILISILLLIPSVKNLGQKSIDVNNNGVIDKEDTNEIIDYLLDIKKPNEDENIEEKDLNNDGQITATDVVQSALGVANQKYTGKITGRVASSKYNYGGGNSKTQSSGTGTQSSGTGNQGGSSGTQSGGTGTQSGGSQGGQTQPTTKPTIKPSPSIKPTILPTISPTIKPTLFPSLTPTPVQSYFPSIGKGQTEYNQTPKKGEELTFDLNIEITPYAEVDSVIVDGKKYPVTKRGENDYTVKLPAPETAGKQDIVISGVVLKNGKEVKAEYKITVDVLKDKPTVDDVIIDTQKTVPEISFNVTDKEGAFIGGKVIVTDAEGKIVFESSEIVKGNNTFKLEDLSKDKEYSVKVELDYDLDSDIYGKPEDNSGSVTTDEIKFKIDADYGFEGQNWTITPEVTENDNLVITFENSYNSYYDVDEIVVSGKLYKVKKIGNKYEVEIEKGTNKGQNTVTVEKVVLKNGSDVSVNQELQYLYLKNMPTIGELTSSFNDTNLSLTFDIKDEDKSIKKIKVYLTDENGNLVSEKEIQPGNNSVDFSVNKDTEYKVKVEYTYDLGKGEVTENKEYEKIKLKKTPTAVVTTNVTREPTEEGVRNITATLEITDIDNTIVAGTLKAILKYPDGTKVEKNINVNDKSVEFTSEEVYKAGKYTIEVQASYEIEDGKTHENEVIGTGVAECLIYSTIENIEAPQYVAKNENFEITYTIKSNTEQEPTGIEINGTIYPITGEKGNYKVQLTAKDSAGIEEYKTTRIIYNEVQISSERTTPIEVLKDIKPQVSALSFEKTSKLLTFNIIDEENTFVSGKVRLTSEGKEPIELNIESKENPTFELNDLEQFVEYKAEVLITYDFDSDKVHEEHQIKDEVLSTGTIEIINDYDFELNEYKLDHIDSKAKKIYVTFVSENASNKYDIQTVDINGTDYEAKVKETDAENPKRKTYIVEIPYEKTEKNELVLQEVILQNLQGFKNGTDYDEKGITVFKTKPKAVAQANVSEDNKSITVQVAITDEEQIITSKKLKLTKEDGTYTETKDIDSNEITFNNDEKFKAGKYTTEVLSTFDSVDGDNHVDEVIGNTDATVLPEINVKSEKASEYYVERSSNATIIYEIISNTTEPIQKLVVNDEELEPVLIEENKYQVTVKTPDNYGIAKYNLTQVIYNEDEKLEVTDVTTTVDVLRNVEPTVNDISVNDKGEKPTLTFNVQDPEETFISGKIKVKETEQEITFTDLQNLNFELNDIDEALEYNIEIFLTYDFDSDKDEPTHQTADKSVAQKTFSILGEYNFNLTDYKVRSVNKDKNTVTLQFKATLNENARSQYFVDTVKINGTTYEDVAREGEDIYTVEIPYNGEERQEFVLEEAILNNLRNFLFEDKKAIIFKKVTAAIIPNVTDDISQIIVTINMADIDEIAKNIKLQLIDSDGNVETREITKDTTQEIFDLQTKMSGKYTLKIVADYDAEDGEGSLTEREVSSTEVVVPIRAIIDKDETPKYVEKDKEFEVVYTIRTNTKSKIQTVVVNDVPCEVTKQEDNKYTVKVTAPKEAGNKDLKVTRINFEQDGTTPLEYTSQTEVLKSEKPTIKNIRVEDSQDEEGKAILYYDLDDIEDTFINGKIIIKDTENQKTQELRIDKQEQTTYMHELHDIRPFTKYDITFELNYDFDNDEDSNDNQHTETITGNQFEVIEDYKFQLENFNLERVNRETQQIELSFESSNASEDNDEHEDYYVQEVTVNETPYAVTKGQKNAETGLTKYTFNIPYTDETRKDLILQKAKLNNLKEFEGFEKHIIVFKTKPKANLETEINSDQTIIKGITNLVDEDSTITGLEAKLINPKSSSISSKSISKDATEVDFASPETPKMFKAGEYEVQLYADYNAEDGQGIVKEQIGSAKIKVATKAKMLTAEVVNYYVEKDGKVEVKYTFESNNDIEPTGINYNNVHYELTKQDDGKFLAAIPADSSSYGEKSLSVGIAMYNGETTVLEENKEIKYYVLKDKPSIASYKFNEFTQNQSLEFSLKNPDNAKIENAEVVLVKDGKEIRKPLNTTLDGETADTTIDLSELEDGTYTVRLSGTYDRTEKGDNKNELSEIFEEKTININSTREGSIKITDVDVQNKQVEITFESTNTLDLEVKKIVVKGQEINVTSLGGGMYKAEIPLDNEGNQTIKIDALKLEYDIRIDLTENNSFEIFKKEPKVIDISAEPTEKGLKVHYTLTDEAGIATNIKAKINSEEKQIADKSAQEVVFENIKDAGSYTIQFVADYDAEDGKEHIGEVIGNLTYELPVSAKITAAATQKEFAEKNEDITITYTIEKNTTEPVTSITIEGIGECQVENGNQIKVNVGENSGTRTFKVTSIKIGETPIETSNEEASVTVLKTKPTINNYKLDRDNKEITFDLSDPDNSITNGKVLIKPKNGETVCQTYENLQNGTNTIKLESYDYKDTEIYSLVLDGTYDLLNGEHPLSEIYSEDFQLQINTTLEFESFSTHYPEREKPVEITFKVTSTNTSLPISEIYVNNNPYQVTNAGESKYKITYTAQDTPGIEDLTVNKVKYADNEVSISEITDKLDILKKKPTVSETNYEIEENPQDKTITFKFDLEDDEDAILKEGEGLKAYASFAGKVDTNGNDRVQLTKGQNTVTFTDVEDMFFGAFTVVADYDLDTDTLDGEDLNQETNANLITINAGMIPATNLDVKDIQAEGKGRYINKNEEFKLSFTAQTIQGNAEQYYPISAMINGTYYELEQKGNTYTTKTTLPSYSDAGKQTITINSVTLNNHQKIVKEIQGEVEVLKSKLTVEKFEVNANNEEGKATATVKLNDPDNSFVSGKLVIKDTSKENQDLQKEVSIDKTKEEYDLPINPFKKYQVELLITTDLDEDQKSNSEHYEENVKFDETKEVELITDYQLQASDFKVIEVNRETNVAKLQFKATNASSHKVAFAKVEDKEEYAGVGNAGEENTYTFDYKFDTTDRKEIKLEKVKLEDNTELEVKEDLKTVIFKEHPSVEFTKVESQENMKIHAEFKVTDNDSTLTSLYAVLKDEQGNENNEQTLTPNATEVTFEGITEPGNYQVVIKADYNAFDGEEHNRETIETSEQKAEIKPNSRITNGTLPTKYPEKGQIIEITYEIASNIAETPTKVTINDQEEIDLISTGKENEYKISYKVPDVAGVKDIDVTKIHYANTIVELAKEDQYELQVDVLKDKPSYIVSSTELLAQKSVIFSIDITDEDNALLAEESTADVHGENAKLKKGTNTVPIRNLELDDEHTLNINIKYDRDSNELPDEDENQNVETLSESRVFTLKSDYGLTIDNLRVIKKGEEEQATYVNKNEPIELRFTSTNNTELIPTKVNVNDTQNGDIPATLKEVKQVPDKPNEYSVDLVASSTAGKQNFEITAVELAGGVMINNDKIKFGETNNPEVTVLKEIPKVQEYTSTNQENSVTVKFNLIDPDGALKEDSKIKLIDDAENTEVESKDIHKGENTHTFNELVPGKKYIIEIENNYRLSDDGANDGANPFKSEPIEITKKEEPNFKVKHLEISKRVPKGKQVEISFENAVMSYKDVDHVTIDGESYEVSKGTDGVYRVSIKPKDNPGINVIQVTTAQIEGQNFPINRSLSYTNEFAEPKATPTIDEIEEDGGKAKIKYKLQDEDSSIRKLTLYMKATSGAVVAKTDIEEGNFVANNETENSAEISLLKLTRYKLELKATCDIGDGKTLEEKSLFEMEKYSPSYVAILENSIKEEQEYVEKGEEVELTFKISTNVDGDAKKIYVNNDQYTVEKVLDEKKKVIPDTYKIKVEAPKDSGVFEQKVTGVDLGNEFVENISYSSDIKDEIAKIKVLKDTPSASHFMVDEQNQTVSLKINDADEAIVDDTPSKLIINKEEQEVGIAEMEKRKEDYKAEKYNGSDYQFEFSEIGIKPEKYPDDYTAEIITRYDRRPDAEPEKVSLWQKIINFFTGKNNEVQTIDIEEPIPTPGEGPEGSEESPSPEPEEDPIKEEKIFTQNIELTGDTIKYNIQFNDYVGWYMFNLRTPTTVQFECSTGTKYKVQKVIFEGKEYPVTIYRDAKDNNGKDIYEFGYIPDSSSLATVSYDSIILENSASFDVKDFPMSSAICMIIEANPTFSIKTFSEDLIERKVRFGYKFVDDDEKTKGNLRFTLCDSQGKEIGHAEPERTQDMVEFNIPDPPTSVYKLTVQGDIYEMKGYSDYTSLWEAYDGVFNSSVTTSIRSSEIKNPYPKKGETIEIIYNISSTKVIRVDKEDHSNQDKAVGISKLVINGKEYDVETLDPEDYGDEKYRIYYTAKDEDGLEDIKVSKVIFTNGEEEEFERTDQIEVLKDEPQITDFSTENNILNNEVTFRFKVEDPDNVLTNTYAEVDSEKQDVKEDGELNELTFKINDKDKVKQFNIKSTYDLDGDRLKTEGDKNNFVESPIFTKPFVLTGKYGVTFDEVKKYNSEGTETEYFEKGSDIKLTYKCKTDYPGLYPETVTINGENHPIEKVENEADLYTTTIKAADTAGKQEITFNSVTLNSGNQVPLENQKVEYEVLKSPVTVESFSYKIGQEDNDKIKLDIKLKDDDGANTQYEMELQDENGSNIPISQQLQTGENEFEFEKTSAGKYFATIYSTYDRDLDNTNFENQANKERIHYEIITVNTRYIEMKDIIDIELYKHGEYGETERVDTITKQVLDDNIDNCIVKVTMKDIPEFYSKITSYKEENNQLKLTLEYQDGMVFTKDGELKPLEVSLDMKNEEYQYGNSFKSLVERMKEHPTEDIVLTKDYDLEEYVTNNDDSSAVISDFIFEGKINGNGHTISNLKKPLFNNLKDATIENLVLKNVSFCGDKQKGSLVVSANNTKISNVHVNEIILIQKNGNPNNTGGIAYKVTNGSVIEKCSVTKLTYRTVYLSQNNAGIVCSLESGSKVENCLVEGDASHLWCNNGGLVAASSKDSEMNNNVVKWPLTSGYAIGQAYGNGNGGIVSNSNGAKMTNTISLSDGNAGVGAIYNTRFNAISNDSSDNYQLDTAILKHEHPGINTISKEQINADFFKNKLHLSEDVWSIPDNASFDNPPKLKGMTNSYIDEGEQPENTQVYIPDYGRVSKLPDYREENEIVYSNMYKLMPFYDAKELINDGNKILADNPLSTKLIKYIIPINKEGKMTTYLTTDTYNSLNEIKIVFEDGTCNKYHVDYDDYYGNVASYMITELKIGYNFNRYVVNANLPIIQELVETASSYDFNNDLEPLTPKEDSRLYKEEFNNKVKNQLQDFVINVLINEGYYPTFENDVIENKVRQEFTDTDKLKQMIFAYTYFKHWYNLDMQGVNVADALMFQSNQMFDSRITLEYLASKLLVDETSKPNNIVNFYNNNLAFYTKLSNLGLYLDHYIQSLTDYEDGNEWFKDNFKGGIYEVVDIGKNDNNLDDTIWDHLKKDWKIQRDILPLLTVPEDSAFVISSPTQVYYGSLRVYMTNPKDPKQIANFKEKYLKLYMEQIKQFYTFAYDYWGAEQLNKYCDTQYDMRTTYTGRGDQTVYNNPLSTDENYHKYFIEAIDRWAGTGGGAYANGNEVFWNVIKMLDGGFRVSTHETLHNQDSKIFMGDYGRRGGAEDYAAGFLQQYYRDGWVSPNIFDEDEESKNSENGSQNLHRSSVDTPAKLERFYRNYFRTNDFLDYIEAQAFFTLTNAEKAQLAIQVSYPQNPDNTNDSGGERVGYNLLTEDAVAKMDLNSMDALWNNRIMLKPGISQYAEYGTGGGDTDSLYTIHWYQPHANNSRPDSSNFKYLAWQMAGERGYYDGLCAYYSLYYVGRHTDKPTQQTTDLTALKYITGKDSFKEYKIGRYNELAQNYNNNDTMFGDIQEILERYKAALKIDAANRDRNLSSSTAVKRNIFRQIRKDTEDFKIDPFTKQETPLEGDNSSTLPVMLSINQEEKVDIESTNTEITRATEYPEEDNKEKNINTANLNNTTNTTNNENAKSENVEITSD